MDHNIFTVEIEYVENIQVTSWACNYIEEIENRCADRDILRQVFNFVHYKIIAENASFGQSESTLYQLFYEPY